jgi:transcriptional regulator NrdR family protein
MICPHCDTECNALVLETRKQDGGLVRKRVCGHCGRPFLSMEKADLTLKLQRARPDKVRVGTIEQGPKAINRDAFKAWR